jgi:ABC-type transport system involved in Fe-S cluster assembly fused permease/ATPase subunit
MFKGNQGCVDTSQVIALARAMLRRNKLLILDEATSAIDAATDTTIQASLRQELGRDTTVLVVAHRLQTIIDYDKIVRACRNASSETLTRGMLRWYSMQGVL